MFKKKEKIKQTEEMILSNEEINELDNDNFIENKCISSLVNWGKLQLYIDDIDITDIKCNSKTVWVKHVEKGTWCLEFNLDDKEISDIAYQIHNIEGVQFNPSNPILQADYGDLRIQCVHESVCPSGLNMTIRKTPYLLRIKESEVEDKKYCTNLCLEMIKNAVQQKMGIVNAGETGSGKTEFAKLECSFIPFEQGVITIEDTSELHLSVLFPQRNIIEMKTNQFMDFNMANSSCLRMDPDWILLSEARGKEISKLMECRSSGHGILTTLHQKNSTDLVERILNMYEQENRPADYLIENMVHEYFDICIHIACDISKFNTHRYIDEISVYERVNQKNILTTIYRADKNFNIEYYELPREFAKKLNHDLVERWNAYEI